MLPDISTRSPEETRLRILAATRELLAKKGRRGTTTREIADLAGVNEATLFRHFGHKDALVAACAQHYCRVAELQDLLGQLTGTLEVDLMALAMDMVARLDRIRDMIVASLHEEELDSAVGSAAASARDEVHRLIAGYMSARVAAGELHGDPSLLARVFLGMIFATVVGHNKFRDLHVSQDELIKYQVDVFLNGVRNKN